MVLTMGWEGGSLAWQARRGVSTRFRSRREEIAVMVDTIGGTNRYRNRRCGMRVEKVLGVVVVVSLVCGAGSCSRVPLRSQGEDLLTRVSLPSLAQASDVDVADCGAGRGTGSWTMAFFTRKGRAAGGCRPCGSTVISSCRSSFA